MKEVRRDWEIYERMIARLMADQIETDLCVTPNARVAGRISGRSRQIDVLIDARHDTDNSRRIIVDAKKRKRKVDVTDVEAFRGLMEDVGATHGYLICPVGHTRAAEKRAQMAVSICLVAFDHIQDFDPSTWPRCMNSRCEYGRVFWDGYPEMTLTVAPFDPTAVGGLRTLGFVHRVGKCDRCGRFHVHCTTCDDTLSIPEDDDADIGHRCRCKLPWFWLASIEKDEEGSKSAELHAVMGIDNIMTIDRRAF
ncbi:restriction endonuclease [Mesorhizobium sp.]|uniref:restriction endonuclease n=1 Tax=Mesorhizobium sp. TaxID=1871066 RepID=UPI00121261F4|nr:restriction endonuclease [Mesorhizobium sp.]TJV18008.1 MAG: restriction endonuclease [Mesorhizobium sp.]